MKTKIIAISIASIIISYNALAKSEHHSVADNIIKKQREMLERNTNDKGFGPQAPRDIDNKAGLNHRIFGFAPDYTNMNLCNIHMHKNAEHKGGEFTKYAGNGTGTGYESGYQYTGTLTAQETQKIDYDVCPNPHGGLFPGDTIEVHYVFSTAQAQPGNTLGSCLGESTINPQLRVETQVYVVVNDENALDFQELTAHSHPTDKYQALNIPTNTGTPIQYAGSTTGPSYNEKGSPFQVTWSVRPKIAKVNIETVGQWCKGNVFKENHAHGVRNLVTNPRLLSEIK